MAPMSENWQAVVRAAVGEALDLGHARVSGKVARASISEDYAREYLRSRGNEGAVAYEIVGDTLRLMRTDRVRRAAA
jgi:hypothetical protein